MTRNVQYTNVCYFRCGFCAFSKGKLAANLRGEPYLVPHAEIVRRALEAWNGAPRRSAFRAASILPSTATTTPRSSASIKDAVPDCTSTLSARLRFGRARRRSGCRSATTSCGCATEGLASLPGTAAEVLDDEIRAVICPDKITTAQWLEVHRTAHELGLRSNNTIMFGHVDGPENWARHLLAVRALQRETGGFTEFVPLPFVHMEAPIYLKGKARPGPSFGEMLLMHAVGRIALYPDVANVQVLLGQGGAARRRRGAERRRQRPRRDVDERVDLACGGGSLGTGVLAGRDGGADPLGGPGSAAAHHALR